MANFSFDQTPMIDNRLSLIICTYNRRKAMETLIESLVLQSVYPGEVMVVDGSVNPETKEFIAGLSTGLNVSYYQVGDADRGLTRQRNYGLARISAATAYVAFLDDDVILTTDYFKEVLKTFSLHPAAIGVGGYITNEVKWQYVGDNYSPTSSEFFYDGWKRKEQRRMQLRRWLGLYPTTEPGKRSLFSHALTLGYLPPTGKTYPVDFVMGVSTFRTSLFEQIQFSEFFEGYGLYEDLDFSIRAAKIGELYMNTAAAMEHYHAPSGRPNFFRYGFMVVRNGWYVWRVWNSDPKWADRVRWWSVTLLMMFVRPFSIIRSPKPTQPLTDFLGRCWGVLMVVFNSPKPVINRSSGKRVFVSGQTQQDAR